ncbi:hypothetical protein K3H38_20620 [Aeromonas veronii]|uniref:hypothetical protein n=1 Tax=Aeromonas veronii TaxID=654 RepID=UPI001F227D88|nr:hypothetical protein [Aeromonas veronii]MCF5885318.1 hypothetical protein [Aeromonas veronii]
MNVVVICQNTLLVEVIRQCMMKKKINTECIHTYRTIDQFYNDEHLNISLLFIENNSTFDVSNFLIESTHTHSFELFASICIFDEVVKKDEWTFLFDTKEIIYICPPYSIESISIKIQELINNSLVIGKVINDYKSLGAEHAIAECEDILFRHSKHFSLIETLDRVRGYILIDSNQINYANEYYGICLKEYKSGWPIAGKIRMYINTRKSNMDGVDSIFKASDTYIKDIEKIFLTLVNGSHSEHSKELYMKVSSLYGYVFSGEYTMLNDYFDEYRKQLNDTIGSRYFCERLLYSIMSNIISYKPTVNSILIFYMEVSKHKLSIHEVNIIDGFIKRSFGNIISAETLFLNVYHDSTEKQFSSEVLLTLALISIGKFNYAKKIIDNISSNHEIQESELYEYVPMILTIGKLKSFFIKRYKHVEALKVQRDISLHNKELLNAVEAAVEIQDCTMSAKNAYVLLFILTRSWPRGYNTLHVGNLVKKIESILSTSEIRYSTYHLNYKKYLRVVTNKINERIVRGA